MDGARCHLNDTVAITALSAAEPAKAEVNCSNCVEVRCEIKNERDTAEEGGKKTAAPRRSRVLVGAVDRYYKSAFLHKSFVFPYLRAPVSKYG